MGEMVGEMHVARRPEEDFVSIFKNKNENEDMFHRRDMAEKRFILSP